MQTDRLKDTTAVTVVKAHCERQCSVFGRYPILNYQESSAARVLLVDKHMQLSNILDEYVVFRRAEEIVGSIVVCSEIALRKASKPG